MCAAFFAAGLGGQEHWFMSQREAEMGQVEGCVRAGAKQTRTRRWPDMAGEAPGRPLALYQLPGDARIVVPHF